MKIKYLYHRGYQSIPTDSRTLVIPLILGERLFHVALLATTKYLKLIETILNHFIDPRDGIDLPGGWKAGRNPKIGLDPTINHAFLSPQRQAVS